MVLGLLCCNVGFAKSNISKSKFYSLIEENGNTGFVLRYHNEKSPSGYEIVMPKNAAPIISDFKSKYGVLGGSRGDYSGSKFFGNTVVLIFILKLVHQF